MSERRSIGCRHRLIVVRQPRSTSRHNIHCSAECQGLRHEHDAGARAGHPSGAGTGQAAVRQVSSTCRSPCLTYPSSSGSSVAGSTFRCLRRPAPPATPLPSCCSSPPSSAQPSPGGRGTLRRRALRIALLIMAIVLHPIEEPPRAAARRFALWEPGLSSVLPPRQRVRGAVDPAVGAAVLGPAAARPTCRAALARA